jgi:glucokinase
MYIGVDFGGTKIRAGLLDTNLKLLKVIEHPTEAKKNKQTVLNNLYKIIAELDSTKVKGIGIASRGLVDHGKGTVIEADKMPDNFRKVQVGQLVSRKFKKKTFIDNDVNCFTLAEGVLGAGKNYNIVVGVALGTGVGGGILINQQVYRGAQGGASEFGKTVVDPDWYEQTRGRWGKLEDLTSGTAMDNLYKLETGKKVGAKEVEERLYQGEKEAEHVFDEMAKYLAIGLANIIMSLNPDVIVMGGGVGKVKALIEPTIKLIPKYVAYRHLARTPIRYAKLGPEAGLIGAALLCRQGAKK